LIYFVNAVELPFTASEDIRSDGAVEMCVLCIVLLLLLLSLLLLHHFSVPAAATCSVLS